MRAQDRECHSEQRSDEESGPPRAIERHRSEPRARASGPGPALALGARINAGPALFLLVASVLAVPPTVVWADPTVLNPDWDRAFERGIEWCAPVGGQPATALLLCAKDARIELIDLATGQSSFPEPIAVPPGTRFGGTTGSVAFGYAVSEIHAFRVGRADPASGKKPGLLWRVAAAPQAQTKGDPEFMTRVVAAQATAAGVLIVRSDGRIAELNRRDGSVRWEHRLPKLDNCTLHVHNASAAILWKDRGALHVAFFDLKADQPQPNVTTIVDPPPIRTMPIDRGIVAVWPTKFALFSAAGDATFHPLDERIELKASTLATYVRKPDSVDKKAADVSEPGALLLLEDGGGSLCAYDLASGRLAWPDECRLFLKLGPVNLRSLWIVGDLVFAMSCDTVGVGIPATAELLCSHHRQAAAVGAGVHDGFAYGLFCENSSHHVAPGLADEAARIKDEHIREHLTQGLETPGGPWPIYIVRQVMIGRSWPRPNEPVDPLSREYTLGEAGLIRDTFWLGGRLVIVEERRVRAYTLP